MEQISKGELFKKRNGFSKTTKRLLRKYNISESSTNESLDTLRKLRKERKKQLKLIKKRKHISAMEKRVLGKSNTKTKKEKKSKEKE